MFVFALSCPHQNNAVKWLPKDHRFQCTKHDSHTSPMGCIPAGRSTRNLDRYVIRRERLRRRRSASLGPIRQGPRGLVRRDLARSNLATLLMCAFENQHLFDTFKALQVTGWPIAAIAQQLGCNRRRLDKWAKQRELPVRQKKHPSPGSAETYRENSAPALARATFSLGLMRETWTLLLQHVERLRLSLAEMRARLAEQGGRLSEAQTHLRRHRGRFGATHRRRVRSAFHFAVLVIAGGAGAVLLKPR